MRLRRKRGYWVSEIKYQRWLRSAGKRVLVAHEDEECLTGNAHCIIPRWMQSVSGNVRLCRRCGSEK